MIGFVLLKKLISSMWMNENTFFQVRDYWNEKNCCFTMKVHGIGLYAKCYCGNAMLCDYGLC